MRRAHGLAHQMGIVARERLLSRLSRFVHEGRNGEGQVYYNYDTSEFPSEEAQGISVFYKNAAAAVLHSYSSNAEHF